MPRSSSTATTTGATSSSYRTPRKGDSSIRRGAAVIRQEITKQFDLPRDNTDKNSVHNNVHNNHGKTRPSRASTVVEATASSSSRSYGTDDFSDHGTHHKTVRPRMSPSSRVAMDESLEYSVDTAPDDVRTFASRGDASQWAKGSVLVSPHDDHESYNRNYNHHNYDEEEDEYSLPPSPPAWSPDPSPVLPSSSRKKTTTTTTPLRDENRAYDFIEDDYVEEFELEDYDEVCHPHYSRKEPPRRAVLRRTQTPPVSKPPKPDTPKKPQRRQVTPEKPPFKDNRESFSKKQPKATSSALVSPTPLFEERRQGPPSPANSSSAGSSAASSADHHHHHHHNAPVPNPMDADFDLLLRDPAYQHAQRAGHVWQSLVGHHIRFPSRWWNGARGPPLGADGPQDRPWRYWGRYASRDRRLRRFVPDRAAPGRLLLHVVIVDLVTCRPLRDVCVGCFHPSARGIRTTDHAEPSWERVRDLWLAVRKRDTSGGGTTTSVMDGYLRVEGVQSTSGPLGDRPKVTNANVRAVFGEEPPVETIFVPESYLYELYTTAVQKHAHDDEPLPPPLVLLQEFVFA